jgi:hypothetical protein
MNRQQHPDDAKAQAKALYAADGPKLASDVTGIPKRTINSWAKAEGWQRQQAGAPPDRASEQAAGQRLHLVAPAADTSKASGKSGQVPASWGLASRVLLRRWADVAYLALDQVEKELGAGHSVKARDCATVAGIATQRGLELAKAVGSGPGGTMPTVAEATSRLRELAADLTSRSRAGG